MIVPAIFYWTHIKRILKSETFKKNKKICILGSEQAKEAWINIQLYVCLFKKINSLDMNLEKCKLIYLAFDSKIHEYWGFEHILSHSGLLLETCKMLEENLYSFLDHNDQQWFWSLFLPNLALFPKRGNLFIQTQKWVSCRHFLNCR